MIDFYSQNSYDINKAKCLMRDIFDLSEEKILTCHPHELSNIYFDDNIKCLCIISDVDDNAKNLLQVYRIEINMNVLLNKLKSISNIYHDTFFIPCDNFNGYYKIAENNDVQEVFLDEEQSSDDRVVFLDF